jgi:hypothetical protein
MTDHLHRLAAHALDRLPAARPRAPSRFEPPAAAAPAAPLDDPPEWVVPVARSRPPLGTPEPPPGRPEPGPSLRPVVDPDPPELADGPIRPEPAAVIDRPRAAGPPVADQPRPHPSPTPVEPVAGSPPAGRTDPAVAGVEPGRRATPTHAARGRAGGPGDRTVHAVTTPLRETGIRLPTAGAEPVEQAAPAPRPPADPAVVAALLAPFDPADDPTPAAPGRRAETSPPARKPAAGAAGPLAGPAAEPAVQVTIGRIEVRAVPPADGPAPGPPPARVMGLDEYLRRRGRGDGP